MFSFTVRSALFAIAASAAFVNAAPSISLKVTGSDSMSSVGDLKVTATVTNTGDETVKLLNDPHSPLSTLPADTFDISSDANGARPSFSGIKAKYVPEVAAARKAFTTLAPGQSIEVVHDLSEAYSFNEVNEGSYAIKARNLFYLVDDSAKVTPIHATTEAHTARLSGNLSTTRPTIQKRASYVGCTASEQSILVSAASAAQNYASGARSYLQSHTSSSSRFTTWFGTYTSSHHNTVLDHFSKISSNDFSSYTYDCTCNDAGVFAFVFPDQFGTVHLCPVFWQVPTTGTDSRGGTLVHESSHFTANGGTDDHVYGQSGCKQLASSNSNQAIDNADSHEYFAENNPAQS
ncbi:hypothetical protein Agabi119p4_8015 [Agaricus bisporus var. burnettii]|uniref:Lysine-specific metallo-endopeptidase domain-containing protein n=1 Tax=Agaricus bisporus var. burnettii TaxID=192524 RepID=A0A8H7C768_AGABI|nr:hypothetical protein Agabi119p4_8015 [Agaricus bisporus var. burnettii]